MQNERDDPALPEPQKRTNHESAVVDGHLYLFGGWSVTARRHFVRNEIWTMNVRVAPSPRRWIRRLAGGRTIPPACDGARCVVVDEMIYSYGGKKRGGGHSGVVYRLDPKKMEWMEVATPIEENRPAPPRAPTAACVPSDRDWSCLEEGVASFLATDSSVGQWRKIGGRTTFMNLNLMSDAKEASIFNFFIFQLRVSCICMKVVGFGIERRKAETTSIRCYGTDRPMLRISFWNGY